MSEIKTKITLTIEEYETLLELQREFGGRNVSDTVSKILQVEALKHRIEPINSASFAPTSTAGVIRRPQKKAPKTPGAQTRSQYHGVYRSGGYSRGTTFRAVVMVPDGKTFERRVEYFTDALSAARAYDRMAREVWDDKFTPNDPTYRDPLYLDAGDFRGPEAIDPKYKGMINYIRIMRMHRTKMGATATSDMSLQASYEYADEYVFRGDWDPWFAALRDRNLDLDLREIPPDAPIVHTNWRPTPKPVHPALVPAWQAQTPPERYQHHEELVADQFDNDGFMIPGPPKPLHAPSDPSHVPRLVRPVDVKNQK